MNKKPLTLLWFDDDPKRSLEDKILRAAVRYQQKYELVPNTVYVNPASLPEGQSSMTIRGLNVVAKHFILPHHYWIAWIQPTLF